MEKGKKFYEGNEQINIAEVPTRTRKGMKPYLTDTPQIHMKVEERGKAPYSDLQDLITIANLNKSSFKHQFLGVIYWILYG